MLRARYTELLRLREYVEQLEHARKRPAQLCTIAVRRHPTEWNLGQNETSLAENRLEEECLHRVGRQATRAFALTG